MLRFLVICSLALSGCVANQMNRAIGPCQGQPASFCFSRIGLPDDVKEIEGQKVYVWNHQQGDVSCNIKMMANKDDIITNGNWNGSLAGCAVYTGNY